jgi:3',5'-cyclic AMP phosphodiesterase CpdA
MKIVHLSDTHLGRPENDGRMRQLTDAILADPAVTPESCTIVHTGDLVDDGARPEQHRAGKEALNRFKEAGFTVLLCPGNHDYGDSWHVDPAAAQQHQAALAEYLCQGAQVRFPVLTRVGDVAFIGLDSNAAELEWWARLYAQGQLGAAQLQSLDRMLDELHAAPGVASRVVVYLHHHPFSSSFRVTPRVDERLFLYFIVAWLTGPFRRLKDSCAFCEVVRDRVDLLLFGHLHYGFNCSVESLRYGIPLALDGGSAICTEHTLLGRAQYRVIDLDTLSAKTRFLRF